MYYLPWVMGLSLTLESTGFSYSFLKPLRHQIEKKNLYVRHPYVEQFQELFPTTKFWYTTYFSYLLPSSDLCHAYSISSRCLENFILEAQCSVSTVPVVLNKLQKLELWFLISHQLLISLTYESSDSCLYS